MKDTGTLKPKFYDDIRSVWEREAASKAEKKGIDIEDEQYSALSNTAGWERLKDYIEVLKGDLDFKLKEAITSGMSESEIGKSAVMATLGKDLLDSLVNRVEDSALIVEQIAHERRGDPTS